MYYRTTGWDRLDQSGMRLDLGYFIEKDSLLCNEFITWGVYIKEMTALWYIFI